MAAFDPGEDVGKLAALDVGEARAKEIPADGELQLATIEDGSFGIGAIGLTRLIITNIGGADLIDEARRKRGSKLSGDGIGSDVGSAGVFEGVGGTAIFEVRASETLTIDAHGQKFIGINVPVRLAEINILIEATRPGGAARQQIGASSGDIGVSGRRGTSADGKYQILSNVALSVVVKKEEKAALQNRAAKIPAELVEMVGLLGATLSFGDGIGGIETAVAEELETGSMKLIGAGFGDHIDYGAAGAAVFGGVCV